MTNEDRNRADARFNKSNKPKADKFEQDANAKAVLDNMARLKALRLAREASEPPRAATVKKARAKSAGKSAKKETPALADWLAGQQSGGRRT